VPARGVNFSGAWTPDKKDKPVPPSHPNARVTLELKALENLDSRLDDPEGVELGGIIYGGRDSDTWPPVEESFDWEHGIITKGASLESETTAATIGEEGIRQFDPMSNLDFLSIPIGKYVENNLKFGKGLKNPPVIFGVNYFLRDRQNNFLNDKTDKAVWLKWMELRVHGDVGAIETPTGKLPKYEDLRLLFKKVLAKQYSKADYEKQFTIRIPENIAKIDRIIMIYRKLEGVPEVLFRVLDEQKKKLSEAREKYGDYILPEKFEN
jgi:phosphoenolpyruvate carboxykinase (GTP)